MSYASRLEYSIPLWGPQNLDVFVWSLFYEAVTFPVSCSVFPTVFNLPSLRLSATVPPTLINEPSKTRLVDAVIQKTLLDIWSECRAGLDKNDKDFGFLISTKNRNLQILFVKIIKLPNLVVHSVFWNYYHLFSSSTNSVLWVPKDHKHLCHKDRWWSSANIFTIVKVHFRPYTPWNKKLRFII